MEYRGFTIIKEQFGYRVLKIDVDCGFYHKYSDALSAIDRYYSLKEV